MQVTFDFREKHNVPKVAELVCANCDRVWSTMRHVPDLSDHKNVQRHRITLFLLPEKRVRIWVNRGHIYREGDDAIVVVNATYSLLMDAYAEWHKRNAAYEAQKARKAAEKKALAEQEAAEWMTWLKGVEARRAERDAAAADLGIA